MKKFWMTNAQEGWTYYTDWGFAWFPMYCQGTFVWLRRYWVTWPEKDGKPVLASDVMADWFKNHPSTYNPEMYRTYYPYDPRSEGARKEFLRENQ